MTPEQVVQSIKADKGIPSRYPVRLIFVDEYEQYKTIVNALAEICEHKVELADHCKAPDVYPDLALLRQNCLQQEGQTLVLGVGEYLRFAFRREMKPERSQLLPLWRMQQAVDSQNRLIIPMFACYDLWERILPEVDPRQQDHLYHVVGTGAVKPVPLYVYSQEFAGILPQEETCVGLAQWLRNWEHLVEQGGICRVVTKLYQNVEATFGAYEIRVVHSAFAYLNSCFTDAKTLQEPWGDPAQWAYLVKQCKEPAKSLKELLLRVLNVHAFDALPILAQWQGLPDEKKWAFWLWFRLFAEQGRDYYAHVALHAKQYADIPSGIYFLLLQTPEQYKNQGWIAQRAAALRQMNYIPSEAEMTSAYAQIPQYEDRMQLLLCNTHAERTLAVATASAWLKQGGNCAVVAQAVQEKFPALACYLQGGTTSDDALSAYMEQYRKAKICGSVPQGYELLQDAVRLDDYASRYSCLSTYDHRNTFFLWIDAWGAEWLPCLKERGDTLKNGYVARTTVAQAVLPSETCFNDAWKDMTADHEKKNMLDKLAHTGLPDAHNYYDCLASELEYQETILQQVDEKLKQYPTVVVTGDHGTSRLAARAFHQLPGTPLPDDAVAKSLGRYCELKRPYDAVRDRCGENVRRVSLAGVDYLVMAGYSHFIQKGKATAAKDDEPTAGELHGGATPEEALVPVVVFTSRCVQNCVLPFVIEEGRVLTRKQHKVVMTVRFEAKVDRVQATLSNEKQDLHAQGQALTDTRWRLAFEGAGTGEMRLEIKADDHLAVGPASVQIKSAGITRNDDPFGGL